MHDLFSMPVFFISFREALEAGIIVSVLLAMLDKSDSLGSDSRLRNALTRQVWLGTISGAALCFGAGAVIVIGFRGLVEETMGSAEDIWEGVFSLLASLIITVMGAVFLRVGKFEKAWRSKLSRAVEAERTTDTSGSLFGQISNAGNKYALFILPFITILREGFEAVIFIAGVIATSPASSIPLSVIAGTVVGIFISFFIYKGRSVTSVQNFLLLPTCLLYLIAAGLFSKGVWHLEAHQWNKIVGGDAAELGSGPGSYDIRNSVWHVNCCNPDLEGGGFWGIFNAVLGWQNSATVGSVVSYNVYWVVVASAFYLKIRSDRRKSRFTAAPGSVREPLLVNNESS
ncbi:high-affinity iron transporter [Geosmithia morbida]|uniref:High-affinity iron transporter n=1 Tax=Geosmithia morbida TaxID=1094350 RepID=A0A9P4YSD1_9HYPO|nr:high-affinity iron transporter [Geosmithia morbida]KAF4122243.1 high-affinity iron transporter [Geosmithia morbida]